MKGPDGERKVGYGDVVSVSGSVTPRIAGATVRLEHAGRGGGFRPLMRTRTGPDGSYRFAVKARRSGTYRAVVVAAASEAHHVTVVGALSARAKRHVLGGRGVGVRGTLLPRVSGRAVRLELATYGGWRGVGRARTGGGGRFHVRWRPRGAGVYRLRVRSAGDRFAAASAERLARIYSYRAGHASWYGPGLYGNPLGCGGTLSPGTLGVAHKYLPCGTKVTFRYRGRSATVPVLDRGPFVAGREWDLTAATKQKLGFGSTGTVWSTR